MTVLIAYPTASGATVTVTESLLAPDPMWAMDCDGCEKQHGFRTSAAAYAHAAGHAATCAGQPPTVQGEIDPGQQLLAALIAKANPDITPGQAYIRGLQFRSDLALAGMTAEEWHDWLAFIVGRVLVVHLDDDGRPHQPRAIALLVAQAEVDTYLAEHKPAVVVASWGAWTE